jgi:hypothetical protein
VLVTEHKGATRAGFQAHARAKGASDLMIPAEVIVVDKLPLLGSGKPDLAAVARLVATRENAAAEYEKAAVWICSLRPRRKGGTRRRWIIVSWRVIGGGRGRVVRRRDDCPHRQGHERNDADDGCADGDDRQGEQA